MPGPILIWGAGDHGRVVAEAVRAGGGAVAAFMDDRADGDEFYGDVVEHQRGASWRAANPLPERPLVSVCIATRDRADLLIGRALPSVLAQTHEHLDIVIVGDCCTDDTAERVAALDDPRIRFENLPQPGEYPDEPKRRWQVAGTAPMNRALDLARGDLITHQDDDDEALLERVERLVAQIRADDCDLVYHPFWKALPDGTWALNDAARFEHGRVGTGTVLYRSWLRRIHWDLDAHLLDEPGDWNRLRKFLFLGIDCRRHPDPLVWLF